MTTFSLLGPDATIKRIVEVLTNIGADFVEGIGTIVTEDECCETPEEFLHGLEYFGIDCGGLMVNIVK